MAAARERITELEAELARLSAHDPLVRSALRVGTFHAQLELDVQRARRYERPLALAIVDVDGFHELNLEHGYGVGDMVLAGVGEQLRDATRAHDLLARSGDEFALLFPETRAEAAARVLNRVLEELASLRVAEVQGVSASAGVATLTGDEGGAALYSRAEDALAVAQAQGGGAVQVADGDLAASAAMDSEPGRRLVSLLGRALDQRDAMSRGPSDSVVDLAGIVGEQLGLDPEEVRTARAAAVLRDIGKVGIPDEILLKPHPLEASEWELIRGHPVEAERIVKAMPGMEGVARVVRHARERWDGTGYPDGLAGAAIPIGSRIVLACDAYRAMRSERAYRDPFSHREAVAELTSHAGSQFDPRVVEALVGHLARTRRDGLAPV